MNVIDFPTKPLPQTKWQKTDRLILGMLAELSGEVYINPRKEKTLFARGVLMMRKFKRAEERAQKLTESYEEAKENLK